MKLAFGSPKKIGGENYFLFHLLLKPNKNDSKSTQGSSEEDRQQMKMIEKQIKQNKQDIEKVTRAEIQSRSVKHKTSLKLTYDVFETYL